MRTVTQIDAETYLETAPPDAPMYAPSATAEDLMHAMAGGPSEPLRLLLLRGPRGEGKTTAGIYACYAVAQRLMQEGKRKLLPIRVAVVRDTWINLERTTLVSFAENAMKGLPVTWLNGKREALISDYLHFYFFGLDNRADADKLQGFQCGILWLEEVAPAAELATGIPAEALAIGITSVRQGGVPKRILVTFNPPDEDHWIVKVEETLVAAGHADILVHRFVMAPGEKAEHFREMALQDARAGRLGQAQEWEDAALEFEAYRRRNRLGLEAIGRPDLVDRLVDGKVGGVTIGEPVVPHFDRAHHVTKEPIILIPGSLIGRFWDAGLCYDDETEVLTTFGWRAFADLKAEDELATRHPVTGRLEYQTPTRLVAEEHDGPMLLYGGSNANFCVTPEHLVPVVPEREWSTLPHQTIKRTAAELAAHPNPHAALCLTARRDHIRPPSRCPMGWPPSVYARLMGWYVAEGSVQRSTVTIYQEKPAPDLEALLAETGLPWRESKAYGRRVGWRVWNRELADEVRGEKRVPPWITILPPHNIREFLDTMLRGDGHRRQRANGAIEEVIFTSSERLAGDLQECAMLAGQWARISRRPAARSAVIRDRDGREHHAESGPRYCVTLKRKGRGLACLIGKNWSTVHYTGMRYCATVPNGTLYVRRNGIAHWNGNTPSTVWAQITPMGNVDILGSRTSENGGMIEHIQQEVWPFQAKYGLRRPMPTRGEGFGAGATAGWVFRDIGDSACREGNQATKREVTVAWVIENMCRTSFEPGPVPWSPRRESLLHCFRLAGRGPGRARLIRIYEPENKMLIAALAGRARYPRNPTTGVVTQTVEALKKASGIWFQSLDALGYGLAVMFPVEEYLQQIQRAPVPLAVRDQPRTWLGV